MPSEGNKTYLVLGASGFLGRNLVRQLLGRGSRVIAFGRNLSIFDGNPLVYRYEAEFGEISKLEQAIDGVDCVFHLINTTSPATSDNNYLFDVTSNLVDSLSLLNICRKCGIKRVVFASSGGTVYGNSNKERFTETTLPSPISSYGVTKLAIENYLYLYNHHHGMHNISLRVANPYGPFQLGRKSQGVVGAFMRAAYRGETVQVWGLNSVRDYIYVDDVSRAFIAAAQYDGKEHIFNIATGIGRDLNSVIEDIQDVSGKSLKKEVFPARDFDVARSVLDVDRAHNQLGWSALADWRATLVDTWSWVVEYESQK